MPTVWLWRIEWASGFQHLPQHVPAGDIDNALDKAKAYIPEHLPSAIRGLSCVAYFQVETAKQQAALFKVKALF